MKRFLVRYFLNAVTYPDRRRLLRFARNDKAEPVIARSGATKQSPTGNIRHRICEIRYLGISALVLLAIAALCGFVWLIGPGPARAHTEHHVEISPEAPTADAAKEFPVPLTPLPKTITPCRACHGPEKDFPVNPQRREDLLVHRNIQVNHGGVRVWCLDCHDPNNRNYLTPLSDGRLIPFEQSYLLCGKCHGTKFRDWRNGIHGKRSGYWNGEKTYFLCVTCHNPHSPRFKPIEPMPPPRKPWTPKESARKAGTH